MEGVAGGVLLAEEAVQPTKPWIAIAIVASVEVAKDADGFAIRHCRTDTLISIGCWRVADDPPQGIRLSILR
jgi:hypothetical protein